MPVTIDADELSHLRLESRRFRFFSRFAELVLDVRGPDLVGFVDECLARGQSPEEAAAVAMLAGGIVGKPPRDMRRRGGEHERGRSRQR
jgi:hypothetical protein